MADEADGGGAAMDEARPAPAGSPSSRPEASRGPKPDTDHTPKPDTSHGPKPDASHGPKPDAGYGSEPDADYGPARSRVWSALATLLGALSLVGGLTWVLLNLHGPDPVVDIATGVVLTLGGLVLLMPHRIRLPARPTWIAAAVTGVGGTAAGIAVSSAAFFGMYAYVVDRGFPFSWLQRGGVADDPDVARRLAATDSWQVDVAALTVNVLVWAYLGMLIVAVAGLWQGARRVR